MSETRFTPGPWRAQCDHPRAKNRSALVITGGGRMAIDAKESGVSFAEDCANAHLIAAAPALYAALAHLVQLLETQEHDGGLNVPGLATLNEARAALSQARGDTR